MIRRFSSSAFTGIVLSEVAVGISRLSCILPAILAAIVESGSSRSPLAKSMPLLFMLLSGID